jgi:putative protease
MPWYQEQISNCTYRQFTTGFFYGKPDHEAQIYDSNTYVKEYTYLGYVEAVDGQGRAQITQRNKFSVGETIEIMKPDGQNLEVQVKAIYDEDGNSVESAPHPQQKLFVDLGCAVEEYDLLRRAEQNA